MRITHLSNSFIVVRSGALTLCCDPWVGIANQGGWHSYPEYAKADLSAFLADTDLVYISHLHDDHFDPRFLVESGLIRKRFVIKNFEIKTLRNRLQGLGAEVTEIDEFAVHVHGHLKLAIIPQMTSNSSGLDDEVNYDLDTSIVVHDGDVTFFNQVDNPLSKADCEKVGAFIAREFGTLTVAALMCGAAGEYPQAFFNVDRETEKARIIESSLERLKDKLLALKPAVYFPAGGTYFIPGKLHPLFKYVAQPSGAEIQTLLKDNTIATAVHFLEGGRTLTLTADPGAAPASVASDVAPISTSIPDSIAAHQHDPYVHEADATIPSLAEVEAVFDRARRNWLRVISEKDITISQDISFVLYSDLTLDADCGPRPDSRLHVVRLSDAGSHPDGELVVHIDIRAFLRCLNRQQSWNGTLFLCLFERRPNVYHPSDTFSLNYLTISKDDVRVA